MDRYTLPYQLDFTVLRKLCPTQNGYFNHIIFNLLNKNLAMKSHRPHQNPGLFESASDHTQTGPIALCNAICEQYGDIVTIKALPTLTERIPESNLDGVGEQIKVTARSATPMAQNIISRPIAQSHRRLRQISRMSAVLVNRKTRRKVAVIGNASTLPNTFVTVSSVNFASIVYAKNET